MRVSSTMMIQQYLNAVNGNYDKQAKLTEENATQQRLNRPSDDPVGYAEYLSYSDTDVANQQYMENANNGISWMKNSDDALKNIKEHYDTFIEQVNQAANSTNVTSDNVATASQLKALLQEAISQGNSQIGDRYLFAGQKDKTQPFTISDNKVERGLAKTLDDRQANFFGKTVNINGVATQVKGGTQVGDLNQMLSMTGTDGGEYYLDPSTGYVFSKDFVQNGYKQKINAGQKTVTAADAVGKIDLGTTTVAKLPVNATDNSFVPTTYTNQAAYQKMGADVRKNFINKYFDTVNGEVTAAGSALKTNGLTAQDAAGNNIDTKFSFNTVNQYVVSYAGDDNKISMVKLSGGVDSTRDSVNLTGSEVFGDSDIFGASHGTAYINDLFTVVAKMDGGDQKWLSSDGITLANNASVYMQKGQTSLASRQLAYSNAIDTMQSKDVTIKDNINNVNGVNTAQVMTQLLTAQTIYNIAISMGKNILPKSIADYLS